jgi:hypothetical protein
MTTSEQKQQERCQVETHESVLAGFSAGFKRRLWAPQRLLRLGEEAARL